jgi:hypothetical protein
MIGGYHFDEAGPAHRCFGPAGYNNSLRDFCWAEAAAIS